MTLRLLLICPLLLPACATTTPRADEDPAVREVRLNATARLGPIAVTPEAIAEDSRCPQGVQCIQAGTVRVEAQIVDRAGSRTAILPLAVPVRLAGGWVSLVQACPYPVHPARIRAEDYRLRLMLTLREAPPLIDAGACPSR
jgi:hypothetical protein